MEAGFCLEALDEAMAKHGRPEIFNTEQGSQFTSEAFTGVLIKNEIAISMDGKGSWRDNVFVERLWKSVKYEEVYLRAYDSVADARASIGRYLDFYNTRRPHSSLDRQTRDEAYFNHLPQSAAAGTSPRFWSATPVGLRPPCVAPQKRITTTTQTWQVSTYRSREAVQTNRASSQEGLPTQRHAVWQSRCLEYLVYLA